MNRATGAAAAVSLAACLLGVGLPSPAPATATPVPLAGANGHQTSTGSSTSTTVPPPTTTTRPGVPTCAPPKPRRAWAVAIGLDGRALWQTPLPVSQDVGAQVGPITTARLAYFFEGGDVTAIDRADGRQIWQVAEKAGSTIYGAWLYQGGLTVLDELFGRHGYARLESLDGATGAVRWSGQIASYRVIGVPVESSGGYLSFATSLGVVATIGLSNGKTAWWADATGQYVGAIAASGPDVLLVDRGQIVARRGSNGHEIWARSVPGIASPALQAVGGLVLVTSGVGGPGYPTAMYRLDRAYGRALWRLDVGAALGPFSLLASAPSGLALQGYHLYLVDPRDGAVNWVDKELPLAAAISRGGTGVVVHSETAAGGEVLLEAQSARTGRQLWERDLPAGSGNVLVASGGIVAVPTAPPPTAPPTTPPTTAAGAATSGPMPLDAYRLSDGRALWATSLPAPFVAGMVLVAGSQLLIDAANPPQACTFAF